MAGEKSVKTTDDSDSISRSINKLTAQPSTFPNEITARWILTHVPVKYYAIFIASLFSSFALGVRFGQTTFVRELLGEYVNISSESAAIKKSEIVFLASDLVLNLNNIYETNIITSEIKVYAQNGFATLSRNAKIVDFSFELDYFLSPQAPRKPQLEIVSVNPSVPIVQNKNSPASITIEFDKSSIIFKGNNVATFPNNSKQKAGNVRVRLYYQTNNKQLYQDINIPIFVMKL